MDVRGNAVTLHRKTATVVETLTGTLDHNALRLRGAGYRLDEQHNRWELEIDGDFPPGATTYSGKGRTFAHGQTLRACELRMTRNRARRL
jgi:hypothetical protein